MCVCVSCLTGTLCVYGRVHIQMAKTSRKHVSRVPSSAVSATSRGHNSLSGFFAGECISNIGRPTYQKPDIKMRLPSDTNCKYGQRSLWRTALFFLITRQECPAVGHKTSDPVYTRQLMSTDKERKKSGWLLPLAASKQPSVRHVLFRPT